MNNKRKPIIGITTSLELNPNRLNDHKTIVSVDYSKAVINAGGIPFILPITENMEVIREQIQHLDGLLLSGGGDPDPNLYGENCLQEIGSITPERDEFELEILDEFMKTGKPILGICRGLQIANIYFGGSLYQDVKYTGTTVNHMQKWIPDLPTHDINIEKDNILFEIFGEKTRTNSFHHQMIKDLGNGLTAIAKANDDGEPSSTAGTPMLEVMKKLNLTNTLLIATRYFGGIKLGASGLIRAYSKTAKSALDANSIVKKDVFNKIVLYIDYNLIGKMQKFLDNNQIIYDAPVFTEKVEFILYAKDEKIEDLQKDILDITNANCKLVIGDRLHLDFVDGKYLKN